MPILEINIAAIKANYNTIKAKCSPVQCSAVVKANAYGLGTEVVSKSLSEEGCRFFWVAYAEEACLVTHAVPDAEVAVFQDFNKKTVSLFIKHHFIPVLNSLSQVTLFKEYRDVLPAPILHVNTGLNRLGLNSYDLDVCLELPVRYIISHLACADAPAHFMNAAQIECFNDIKKRFPLSKYSLSASDGVFLDEIFHGDLVRAGAALYGVNTTPYRENIMKPVITVKAPILQIFNLKQGDYVGYGATYRAYRDTTVATVSLGYADGLPRSLSNRGRLWYKQQELPIIGRVSMDMVTCDISCLDNSSINEGDYVDMINEFYTIDDFARDSDTISYEVLSRLGTRLNREY